MYSTIEDPFYAAKAEMETYLEAVKKQHSEWASLLSTENTAKSSRFQELHANISGELQQLDFDLQEIKGTIVMVEGHPDKFKFDDREIASRKEFAQSVAGRINAIRDSLTSRQTLEKIERDKNAVVASKAPARKAATDRQVRIQEENQSFLNDQRQEQAQLVRQQDEALTELSRSTQRLGETARVINRELQDQQEMLGRMGEDLDKETEKMNFVMKRMGRLLKTSDNKMLCTIISLIILFCFLLFLLIS